MPLFHFHELARIVPVEFGEARERLRLQWAAVASDGRLGHVRMCPRQHPPESATCVFFSRSVVGGAVDPARCGDGRPTDARRAFVRNSPSKIFSRTARPERFFFRTDRSTGRPKSGNHIRNRKILPIHCPMATGATSATAALATSSSSSAAATSAAAASQRFAFAFNDERFSDHVLRLVRAPPLPLPPRTSSFPASSVTGIARENANETKVSAANTQRVALLVAPATEVPPSAQTGIVAEAPPEPPSGKTERSPLPPTTTTLEIIPPLDAPDDCDAQPVDVTSRGSDATGDTYEGGSDDGGELAGAGDAKTESELAAKVEAAAWSKLQRGRNARFWPVCTCLRRCSPATVASFAHGSPPRCAIRAARRFPSRFGGPHSCAQMRSSVPPRARSRVIVVVGSIAGNQTFSLSLSLSLCVCVRLHAIPPTR